MPAQRAGPRGSAAPGHGVDASPAKLPVRRHEVSVIGGDIMVTESEELPNLPPGLTVDGHL